MQVAIFGIHVQRILVIGSGGAGKTTFARRLASRTGIPLVHLDAEYWRSGWVPTPTDEWHAKVADIVRGDAWVMDGNYGGTLDARFAACDTIIFLDVARLVCLWRVVSRWLRHRGRSRPDMTPGCPERLTWEFVTWIWTYPSRRRPEILRRLAALGRAKRVIVLRSSAAADDFLEREVTRGNAG